MKGVWVVSTKRTFPPSDSSVTVSSPQLTAWIFSWLLTYSVNTQTTEAQQVIADQWKEKVVVRSSSSSKTGTWIYCSLCFPLAPPASLPSFLRIMNASPLPLMKASALWPADRSLMWKLSFKTWTPSTVEAPFNRKPCRQSSPHENISVKW